MPSQALAAAGVPVVGLIALGIGMLSAMQYGTLGSTGVTVSRLCFGTMSFGGDADEAMSGRMFARCREAGINFFDCANVYAAGRSEEILGRLMAGQRDQLVITSKVGMPPKDQPLNGRGLARSMAGQRRPWPQPGAIRRGFRRLVELDVAYRCGGR